MSVPGCAGVSNRFAWGLGRSAVRFVSVFRRVAVQRIDADAFSIRGFVHALVMPLVAISTSRSRDWKKRLVLSQRAALQSATLVSVGVYLLFMSAAGYYVRYFGGEWGRALQLALLFAALLLLGVLSLSGSMRAKFGGLDRQAFFQISLRLPGRMAALYQHTFLAGRFFRNGKARDQGLGGYGGESGRVIVVESSIGWVLCTIHRLEHACFLGYRRSGKQLVSFSGRQRMDHQSRKEYRSAPRRYEHLEIPLWLAEVPNAWLVVPLATGNEMIGFVILATARTQIEDELEVG